MINTTLLCIKERFKMSSPSEKISKLESKVNLLETKLASIEKILENYQKLVHKLNNDFENRMKNKREESGQVTKNIDYF